MNYLGHLYFSNNDLDLMHANLFGDFVKGTHLEIYLDSVRRGIILHRSIDTYIGKHPQVKELVLYLSSSLPKVASVAVDIYFDHFLSIHWGTFHAEQIDSYLSKFYSHPIQADHYPDPHFLYIISRIKTEKWLSGYSDLDVISRVCRGVSGRISFPNALVLGGQVLQYEYQEIETVFFDYMKDARAFFG